MKGKMIFSKTKSISRESQTFIAADEIDQEKQIVWLRGRKQFAYVREMLILSNTRSGEPRAARLGNLEDFAVLAGYADLNDGAEKIDGFFRRRIFWLKKTDRQYEPNGPYHTNAPCEAVDPLTVETGVPGRKTKRVNPSSLYKS